MTGVTPIDASVIEIGNLDHNGVQVFRGMLIQFDDEQDLKDAMKGVPVHVQWIWDRQEEAP